MEAAGVVLFNPLILRKLLVSLEATSAKNATLPGGRSEEQGATTKELLDEYFQGLANKFGWEHLIADGFRLLSRPAT